VYNLAIEIRGIFIEKGITLQFKEETEILEPAALMNNALD